MATDPAIAAIVMARGMRGGPSTGAPLWRHLDNDDERDFMNACRMVNGTDRADEIAANAERSRRALAACQGRRWRGAYRPGFATTCT